MVFYAQALIFLTISTTAEETNSPRRKISPARGRALTYSITSR
jgi:hypothetical protein